MVLCFILKMAWIFWVYSISGTLGEDKCKAQLNPEVHSMVKVKYDISLAKINKEKLNIIMNDGFTFKDLLSSQCEDFPQIYLEYREKGSEDFEHESWTTVEILKHTRRHKAKALKSELKGGKVSLHKDLPIDLCKVYDIRFSINGEKSSNIVLGPFDRELDIAEIETLPYDAEDILNVKYEETGDGFIAEWDKICARSLKIFLQEGDNEFKEVAQLVDILENNFNNSMKFFTKPCTKYTLQVESYWTAEPKESEGNLHDASDDPFFSSPEASSFGGIQINSSTMQLSWDLSGYANGCVINISYKITLETKVGEELLVLKEVNGAVEYKRITLNITDKIKGQNVEHLFGKCQMYQIKTAVWYTTASGKQKHNFFAQHLITNYEGQFTTEEDDQNVMSLTDENEIVVQLGSCIQNATLVVLDVGKTSIRTGKSLEQSIPSRIIASKNTKMTYSKFNLTDFLEDQDPCALYSIQLMSQDQFNLIETNITNGDKPVTLAESINVPMVPPQGSPILRLDRDFLEIIDKERNKRCVVKKYTLKCWKTGGDEATTQESSQNTTRVPLKYMEQLTANTEISCKAMIVYTSTGFTSPWTETLTFKVPGLVDQEVNDEPFSLKNMSTSGHSGSSMTPNLRMMAVFFIIACGAMLPL